METPRKNGTAYPVKVFKAKHSVVELGGEEVWPRLKTTTQRFGRYICIHITMEIEVLLTVRSGTIRV